MEREVMAQAIERVLRGFTCPEIEEVTYLGEEYGGDGATVAIQAADGSRFFVEVQDV